MNLSLQTFVYRSARYRSYGLRSSFTALIASRDRLRSCISSETLPSQLSYRSSQADRDPRASCASLPPFPISPSMSNHFEITLNGVTEDLEMKQRPPSLVDFLDSIKSELFVSTSTRFSRINSFEYLHRNEDHPDYMELVSGSTDYDLFLEYLDEDDRAIIVELIVDPKAPQQYKEAGSESQQKEEESDETKDLMEKVKKALENDHSLAEKLKGIVHEVCGPHPPDHHRGHGERGRGRGRGRGSHRGEGRRPPFEHGPFPPPRHRHDHRSDDDEGPHPRKSRFTSLKTRMD